MKYATIGSVLLALLAQNPAAAAACSDTRCSGEISELYVTGNGDVYVAMVGGLAGLTGCTPNQGAVPYLTLSASSRNLKLMYATLLANQMAGRSVSMAMDAASTGCTIRYVISQ